MMHHWLSRQLAAGDRAEQIRPSEPGPKNLIGGGPPHWLLISLRPGCRDADPMDLLGECEHL